MKDGFQKAYEALGGKVVISETFVEAERDIKTTLTKLSQDEVDALVMFVQSSPTAAQILKQIRELGIKLPIFGNEIFAGDAVVKTMPELAEGLVFAIPKLDIDHPRTKNLLEKYRIQYPNENPPNILYVATAYDAVYLAKEAIEHCDTDATCMKKYFYSLKDWEGAAGKLTFDQNGDPVYEYEIKTIRNGVIVEFK